MACGSFRRRIFKDGGLAGPDDGAQLQDLCSRYVNARQTWLRGIRKALDVGQTVASARADECGPAGLA